MARQRVRWRPVYERHFAVHENSTDPGRLCEEARGPTGQIASLMNLSRPDLTGIEENEVGMKAHFDAPPIAKTKESSGSVAQGLDSLFERPQLSSVQTVGKEVRRVGCSAHSVEMSTGVGSA